MLLMLGTMVIELILVTMSLYLFEIETLLVDTSMLLFYPIPVS
jgi:hypothetical protein